MKLSVGEGREVKTGDGNLADLRLWGGIGNEAMERRPEGKVIGNGLWKGNVLEVVGSVLATKIEAKASGLEAFLA